MTLREWWPERHRRTCARGQPLDERSAQIIQLMRARFRCGRHYESSRSVDLRGHPRTVSWRCPGLTGYGSCLHEFPIRNRAHGPTGGLWLDFCDPSLSAYPGQTATGPCLASAIRARAHRREVLPLCCTGRAGCGSGCCSRADGFPAGERGRVDAALTLMSFLVARARPAAARAVRLSPLAGHDPRPEPLPGHRAGRGLRGPAARYGRGPRRRHRARQQPTGTPSRSWLGNMAHGLRTWWPRSPGRPGSPAGTGTSSTASTGARAWSPARGHG